MNLISIQSILTSYGLIKAEELSLTIANSILTAIRESFNKREYGLELRLGYLQEVVHDDPAEDDDGYIYGYIKYEKPLAPNYQFTSQLNLYYHAVTEQEDKELSIHWLNSTTRQYGQKFSRKLGLELDYNKVADVTTWEKLFVELQYEISDIMTWENELNYTLTQYEAEGLRDKQEYVIQSRLAYTIW